MKIFVGSYTQKLTEELTGKGEGIYCLDFDEDSGKLNLTDITPARNPSYLALSKNGKYLYAVEELPMEEAAKINAYKIISEDDSPSISLINQQNLPGSYACHLSLTSSQKHLVVASYMSGNILLYPVGKNGRLLPLVQNIQHHGSGPDKTRQEAPHPHMIYPSPDDNIFVVDLGLDLAKAYKYDPITKQLINIPDHDIAIRKGAGSRHMITHPDLDHLFIFSEMSAEIFSFRIKGERTELIEEISSLPDDHTGTPGGAAIRIHPNGKFLYVSNRSNNSISVFHFDKNTEKLTIVGVEPTAGDTPRDFNIDPLGKWLLVANQDSDSIIVFKINQTNGLLQKVSENKDIKTPSCILFMWPDKPIKQIN